MPFRRCLLLGLLATFAGATAAGCSAAPTERTADVAARASSRPGSDPRESCKRYTIYGVAPRKGDGLPLVLPFPTRRMYTDASQADLEDPKVTQYERWLSTLTPDGKHLLAAPNAIEAWELGNADENAHTFEVAKHIFIYVPFTGPGYDTWRSIVQDPQNGMLDAPISATPALCAKLVYVDGKTALNGLPTFTEFDEMGPEYQLPFDAIQAFGEVHDPRNPGTFGSTVVVDDTSPVLLPPDGEDPPVIPSVDGGP